MINFDKINGLVNKLCEDIEAIKKYFPKIEDNMIRKLIALDPTYQGRENLGTYGRWILNIFNKGLLKEEDFYKVMDYLKEFNDNKKKFTNKDIFQFKSLPDLAQGLDSIKDVEDTQSARQQQRELKKQGAKDSKLVYSDSDWEVWIPETYEASCKLGAGTRWCTAHTENSRYYDEYSKESPLYIIVNKEDPEEKYQFHFTSGQFMDKNDRSVYWESFLKENEGLKKFFGDVIENNIEYLREDSSYIKLVEDPAKFVEKNVNAILYAPDLFFLLKNPSKEAKSLLVEAFGDTYLKYNKGTNKVTYSSSLDYFLDNVISDGGRDSLSTKYIKNILNGETYFDVSVEYSEVGYELNRLKSKDEIAKLLSSVDIDFNDVINYFENDADNTILRDIEEEAKRDVSDLLDEIERHANSAKESGISGEAMKDITKEIQNVFPDFKIDWNVSGDEEVVVSILFNVVENMLDYYDKKIDDINYEGFLSSYTKADTSGELIRIEEPRYGWDDFDSEYFNDSVLDSVNSFIKNSKKWGEEAEGQRKLF